MNSMYETSTVTPHQVGFVARLDTWLARIALAGGGVCAAILVLLHILRPDVDPIGRRVMEYALGPYGLLMNLAYLVLGLGALALVAGLARAIAPLGRSRFGLLLLAAWGVSALLAAVFNVDPRDAPRTLAGLIHIKAALLGFPSAVFATLLLPDRWRHDPLWAPVYRPVGIGAGRGRARRAGVRLAGLPGAEWAAATLDLLRPAAMAPAGRVAPVSCRDWWCGAR